MPRLLILNNNNVTTCEVNQTNEDDKKIYYKVVKNGTDTENLEIDKETNSWNAVKTVDTALLPSGNMKVTQW